MIHVVHAGNRHLYAAALDKLHAARFRHFVLERGWSLAHADGQEKDAYDDDLACHLIGFERNGDIAVSCRIRPTLTGGVIPDLFPKLLAAGEPSLRVQGAFECTRYFCASHLRGRAGFGDRSRLHLAMVELMHARGGQRLVGFVDLPMLGHLRRYGGLRLRVLGHPQPYADDKVAVAFEIGCSADDLEAARRRLGLLGRQLFDAPAWLDAAVDAQALAQALDVYCNGDASQISQLSTLAAAMAQALEDREAVGARFDRLKGEAA